MPSKYRYRPDSKKSKNDSFNWKKNWYWIFLLFWGIEAVGEALIALIPFLLIGGFLIYSSLKKKDNPIQKRTTTYNLNKKTINTKTRKTTYSPKDMDLIDKKLSEYFLDKKSLPVIDNISLRLKADRYVSLKSLNVYMNNEYITSLEAFSKEYPKIHDQILDWLIIFSKEQVAIIEDNQNTVNPSKSSEFIRVIDDLNIEIPDETISNGLYETSALLKQIMEIEKKMDGSDEKLDKLYEYYLPMLVNNLNKYKDLQVASTNTNFTDTQIKLQKNITLINEAMKTIATSLYEDDFINLSADISTLEALLKKDGLAGNNNLSLYKKEENHE